MAAENTNILISNMLNCKFRYPEKMSTQIAMPMNRVS